VRLGTKVKTVANLIQFNQWRQAKRLSNTHNTVSLREISLQRFTAK